MHFRTLELAGFKSFADKTRFDFEPGVTAIVGPNGCGKSNIADAIRWVLGEQNARLLRGLRMEDVIFSGTDKRKPLGLAEVSLTLSGVDQSLPVEYSEITVTRRSFRSGESQYLINKNPCRLKDIDDLFMGTGIGLSAYSIIEQGKIEMVLSSKPEDRRFIFEEAAGITKYKERKREALRKLESTEANLVRLSDIIAEVKRQLASVERQAARARRAKEIGDRLRAAELQHGAMRLSLIDARILEAAAARDEAKRKEAEAQKRITELECEGETLREELRRLDQELDTVQARREGVTGTIETSRNRIEADERLILELEEAERLRDEEMRGLEETLGALRHEREDIAAASAEARRERERAEESLSDAEEDFSRACAEFRGSEERLNAQQAELIETITRLSRCRNDIAASKQASRSAALRAARLGVEVRELEERCAVARETLASRRARTEELERRYGLASRGLEELLGRLREARRTAGRLGGERLERERALARCESRCVLLRKYAESYEGFERGVRSVMNEARRDGTALTGIIGVVADKLKAPPGYGRALEAALGHALQCILAKSLEDVQAAASRLDERAEASFLPCSELSAQASSEPPDGNGLLGRALDHVTIEAGMERAAEYLLADTYFVADIGSALELLPRCRSGVRLATLAGDLLVAGGHVRVVGRGKDPSPLLCREEEIARAQAELESARHGLDEVVGRISQIEGELGRLSLSCDKAREEARRAEIELAGARTEDAAAASALERLEADLDAARREAAEVETAERESSLHVERLERQIAGDEVREREIQASLGEARKTTEAQAGEREERQARVMELKVLLAGARGKESSLSSALERLNREIEKADGALLSRSEQRLRVAARRAELAAEIESLRTAISRLESERMSTDAGAREKEERKAALYERQKSAGDLLREAVASLGALKDEVARLDVALAEQRAARRGLCDAISEQYGEDLGSVRIDGSITDWEEIARSIQDMREKLRRLGPVNMVALEEHEELEGRMKFLTAQEADLLAAKESLVKAIQKINAETTRMFTETFEAVRANFREMFRELFEGGTADLLLEEGAHVLEAGINIVARPPGKKLQSISLLSGGEKALTAIALLFAIFKVRPSPFCVLDEIDAPLDESNISRFLTLVEPFVRGTQFIIVTHNKRTISMADVMYGITMEESGVSKVVSVKFGKKKMTNDKAQIERNASNKAQMTKHK